MDLRQLRYFVTVARSGSFTAAARQLHISQPALGLQVKQLETQQATKLLVRHSRGVALTEAGHVFLKHACGILEQVQRAEASLDAFRPEPITRMELRLGILPSTARSIMPDLIRVCDQTISPAVRISAQQNYDDVLLQELEKKNLDMVFCYERPMSNQVGVIPLYYDNLVLVGPKEVLEQDRADVKFADLPKFPLIMSRTQRGARALVEKAAHKHGIDLSIPYKVEAFTLKRDLLLTHGCCTIVTCALFLDDIENEKFGARRIVEPTLSRCLYLAFDPDLPSDVLQFMQKAIREIVELRHATKKMLGWERITPESGRESVRRLGTGRIRKPLSRFPASRI